MYSDNIKDILRENAYSVMTQLISEYTPFRLVLWQNDNWDIPLPKDILERMPDHLTLDISTEVLDHISYEEDGSVVLCIMFGDTEYYKVVEYDEIVAIVSMQDGQPYALCNFPQEPKVQKDYEDIVKRPETREQWIQEIVEDGIDVESAERSVSSFMKYNENLLKG